MDSRTEQLIDQLVVRRSLPLEGYEGLLDAYSDQAAARLAQHAVAARRKAYGSRVFIRGLVEVSNWCKNDCLYCGLRASNRSCERYRLAADEILACCEMGYALGFRTFVLQAGEDPLLTDDFVCGVVRAIKEAWPECAVTLSLGERSRESYAALRRAGADRYLLRHEAASPKLYASLHPKAISLENRMRCLQDLRELGFAVGAGFMVGAPGQTAAHLAADLKFIERFQPEMCGIGPFIPHHATPFADEPAGSLGLSCYLLSIVRLICPAVLLPATTALASVQPDGRERVILAGANVVMPNLSPAATRAKYEIYNNKAHTGIESAEGVEGLDASLRAIGYHIEVGRGDPAAA